ncbi:MAG: efflux RND transporter periplasmic adaptor subunit [Planctomycetaceae bacterium]
MTSSWKFSSRWQRIHVAVAGMYIELALASIAVFLWTQVTSDVARHLLYNIIIMSSVSTLIFNANPLMKFDGYYLLSDLLQVPNLYTRSSQILQAVLQRLLLGIRPTTPVATGRFWLLLLYGAAAVIWRLLVCGTMLITASVLFHGAGLALSVLGMLAWFGMPVLSAFRSAIQLFRTAPLRLGRGLLVGGTALAVPAAAMFLMPVPFSTTAPGIVSLPDGNRIRAEVDGFIERIAVQDGQTVAAGDLLLVLRNEEITNGHRDLELQIQQETIRQQQAMRDHDSGMASVAASNLKSLRDQLQETQRQLQALQVVAPVAGQITARDLKSRLETSVSAGDELLIVDSHQAREFRISVSQEDFPLAERRVGNEIDVRIGTRGLVPGELTRVIPRASRKLFDPALAATAGGPLAVAAADDSSSDLELTEQRFEAVVTLKNPGDEQPLPGERGVTALGHQQDSLAEHLHDRITRWIRRQLTIIARADSHAGS